jgi:hypothetical protein
VIAYLVRRRFNMIDALGLIWIALTFHDRNWFGVAVVAATFPVLSVLAERALPEPPEVKP